VFSLGGSLGEDFSAEWIKAHTRDAHEILGKPFVLEVGLYKLNAADP
jgi:DNA topoisomerase VI subunit B